MDPGGYARIEAPHGDSVETHLGHRWKLVTVAIQAEAFMKNKSFVALLSLGLALSTGLALACGSDDDCADCKKAGKSCHGNSKAKSNKTKGKEKTTVKESKEETK